MTGTTDAASPGEQPHPVSIHVQRGDPSPEELAALMAVVTEAYVTDAAAAVSTDLQSRTAWSVSQRGLRSPLRRELGWTRSTW